MSLPKKQQDDMVQPLGHFRWSWAPTINVLVIIYMYIYIYIYIDIYTWHAKLYIYIWNKSKMWLCQPRTTATYTIFFLPLYFAVWPKYYKLRHFDLVVVLKIEFFMYLSFQHFKSSRKSIIPKHNTCLHFFLYLFCILQLRNQKFSFKRCLLVWYLTQ